MTDSERMVQQHQAIWRGLDYGAAIVNTMVHMESQLPEACIVTLSEADLLDKQDRIKPLWNLLRRAARLTPEQIDDLAIAEGDTLGDKDSAKMVIEPVQGAKS